MGKINSSPHLIFVNASTVNWCFTNNAVKDFANVELLFLAGLV